MPRYLGNKNKHLFIVAVISTVVFCFNFRPSPARGAAPEDLKNQINNKSQELQNINTQINAMQKQLSDVQTQGKSLQKEIKQVDAGLNQVNLSIQSSEITIEKLNLEIDSIQYDIKSSESQINSKKDLVVKTIREIQQNDADTALTVFLKNKSLGEIISETQNLVDLNLGLSNEVSDLTIAKTNLVNQLKENTQKQAELKSENQTLKNKQLILKATKEDRQNFLKQTKNQEKVYQSLVSDLTKRQTDIANELEKMDEELRLKIDPSALPTKRPGVLTAPVLAGSLSQGYGATKFARNGYQGHWHNGVDLAAPIGTPIFAAEKGKVVAAGNNDVYCYKGAYGRFIVIEHENNLTTLYGHLSLQIVSPGNSVNRGDLIGYVGRTGYATGPHLHFTVYASQTFRMGPSKSCGSMPYGGDLNPLDYL